jgi:hypothetical protein
LDDVCEALDIDIEEEGRKGTLAGEYSTIGGLLCAIAGRQTTAEVL